MLAPEQKQLGPGACLLAVAVFSWSADEKAWAGTRRARWVAQAGPRNFLSDDAKNVLGRVLALGLETHAVAVNKESYSGVGALVTNTCFVI